MSSAGARRRALRGLLARGGAREQAELARGLAEEGFVVSQSTVSRDLRYLGVVKNQEGRYRLNSRNNEAEDPVDPERRLGRVINSYTLSIEASANLVVMRTFPGAASVVASALDASLETGEVGNVLGTLAGDDTILVVAARPSGGRGVKERLEQIGEMT
ncbi:MAG: arginine repressor [bacterium]|nr:arginine repressor [bacterium]MDE0501127.1 arginine repressor [bacterium]